MGGLQTRGAKNPLYLLSQGSIKCDVLRGASVPLPGRRIGPIGARPIPRRSAQDFGPARSPRRIGMSIGLTRPNTRDVDGIRGLVPSHPCGTLNRPPQGPPATVAESRFGGMWMPSTAVRHRFAGVGRGREVRTSVPLRGSQGAPHGVGSSSSLGTQRHGVPIKVLGFGLASRLVPSVASTGPSFGTVRDLRLTTVAHAVRVAVPAMARPRSCLTLDGFTDKTAGRGGPRPPRLGGFPRHDPGSNRGKKPPAPALLGPLPST